MFQLLITTTRFSPSGVAVATSIAKFDCKASADLAAERINAKSQHTNSAHSAFALRLY